MRTTQATYLLTHHFQVLSVHLLEEHLQVLVAQVMTTTLASLVTPITVNQAQVAYRFVTHLHTNTLRLLQTENCPVHLVMVREEHLKELAEQLQQAIPTLPVTVVIQNPVILA